jgi:hypothetical protein
MKKTEAKKSRATVPLSDSGIIRHFQYLWTKGILSLQ